MYQGFLRTIEIMQFTLEVHVTWFLKVQGGGESLKKKMGRLKKKFYKELNFWGKSEGLDGERPWSLPCGYVPVLAANTRMDGYSCFNP